jgi:hypothetical protein
MTQRILPALLLALAAPQLVLAQEPSTRPISQTDSVLAVYREDWGLASRGDVALIFAAWPDGKVVWSAERVQGGPPYRTGKVEPKKVAALLARFEKDGLFADKKLGDPNFGPESQFITVFVKSGKQQIKMRSWHELFEESDNLADAGHGVEVLEGGKRRLDVLRTASSEFLFYRLVWSETRGKLAELIPSESSRTEGKPVMKHGDLSWQEGK